MRHIRKSAWLLAIVSGVLQVVIYPAVDWHVLCWVAFAPLLVALLRARRNEMLESPESFGEVLEPATAWQGFLLAFVSGLIATGGTSFWVYHVMHVYGGLDAITSGLLLVLFSIYIAAHYGAFGALLALAARKRKASERPVARVLLLAPFLWVAVELWRTYVTGFPWNLLGTVQVDNIPLSRIATVTGVYGLSFEIFLVNTAVAAAFVIRKDRRRQVLFAVVACAALVQSTELFKPTPLPAPETARLVQANVPIPDRQSWDEAQVEHILRGLKSVSLEKNEIALGAPAPSMIIWPESPAPFFVADPRFRQAISSVASQGNAFVVAGAIGTDAPLGDMPKTINNSAAVFGPDGVYVARYDKIHLVPFGEFVPFKSILTFAEKLTREVGDYVPGAGRTVFNMGSFKTGVFICYESIFPGEVRHFAKNGATVLVNISNDGWFGRHGAPEQHLNMARMRAVENSRWVLRGTNTGVTAAIDPYGRVVESAPREVQTYLDAPFAPVQHLTFYTRYGDWFPILCAIISVLALVVPRLVKPQRERVVASRGISRKTV